MVKQPDGGVAPGGDCGSGCGCGGGGGEEEATVGWSSRHEAFDFSKRDGSPLAARYRECVERVLDEAAVAAAEKNAPPVAALVMECVLHGAGGESSIQPLFNPYQPLSTPINPRG